MAIGLIAAAAGVAVYFMSSKLAGVLLMVAGISVLIITWTIAGVFFQIKMREEYKERKRMNEK
ncbi:MAG: hypothetical protein FWH45_01480 [Methanomassiliicoccaceae archaeon]|nr:hypothetical protein [Methanomassiliicoccaceae archaeon]MCL2145836.1 hypothetical protein [Methanomassiliicoccaceae archaeon]